MNTVNDYISLMASEEQLSWFYKIARTVLSQYDINDSKLTYCGRSEHVTFHVHSTQRGEFLLRLHVPYSDARNPIWIKQEYIQSELMWLNALVRETGLVVQQPMLNSENKFVSRVSVDKCPQPIHATLLTWIKGSAIDKIDCSLIAYKLGYLVAQLHEHSSQWELPSGFIRPRYDDKWLQASLMKLQSEISTDIISRADLLVIKEIVDECINLTDKLGEEEGLWGLIHADLKPENCVLDEKDVRIIDFGCCGFGYYLYDIAWLLTSIPEKYWTSFTQGYQSLRNLPNNYDFMIDFFLVTTVVNSLLFWSNIDPQKAKLVSSCLANKENIRQVIKMI